MIQPPEYLQLIILKTDLYYGDVFQLQEFFEKTFPALKTGLNEDVRGAVAPDLVYCDLGVKVADKFERCLL